MSPGTHSAEQYPPGQHHCHGAPPTHTSSAQIAGETVRLGVKLGVGYRPIAADYGYSIRAGSRLRLEDPVKNAARVGSVGTLKDSLRRQPRKWSAERIFSP